MPPRPRHRKPASGWSPEPLGLAGRGRFAGTKAIAWPGGEAWNAFLETGAAITSIHAPHQIVVREDEKADFLYRVASGHVLLFRMLSGGRRQIVGILSAGDFFGLSSTGLHDCSAETIGDVELFVISQADLLRSAPLQACIALFLPQRLEALHAHVLLLGRMTALERLASLLMRFVPGRGCVGCRGPSGPDDRHRVVLRMSRTELADYLGLTVETVSRVLTELTRRGVIRIERAQVVEVEDVCQLCQLTGIH